jgi:CRP/FNR family transcriptional regulator, dissimilatory nitrate respiration regulator
MEKISNTEFITPCNAGCSFCFLNYTDILGNNFLFRGMKFDEIGSIIRNIHHQVKKFQKGELIACSGEEYNNLLIIMEGAVVGEIVDFEGKVLRIEELKAPDTIAASFIFGNDSLLPVNITAVSDTRLLIIPRQDLVKLFRQNEQVLFNYLTISANRAQHLSQTIRMLGFHTIRGRLANYLLEQVKKENSTVLRLPHSQKSLAEMFGIARPSLARVIRELNGEGIISSKGKVIRILDKRRLSRYLN